MNLSEKSYNLKMNSIQSLLTVQKAGILILEIFLGVLMSGVYSEALIRPPAVAGTFYSADADELRHNIREMLDSSNPGPAEVVAMVVPHAGLVYSGITAAHAFRSLENRDIHRIILLGPSHRMNFSGAALPARNISAFSTPLGAMELDTKSIRRFRRNKLFSGPASAHDAEHCLEVEIPFLQILCPKAKIIPILIGASSRAEDLREIAVELSFLLDETTVIIVSSDFTHHGENYRWAPFARYPNTRKRLEVLCRRSAELVAGIYAEGFRYQVDLSGDTICGRDPILILLNLLSHAFQGRGIITDISSSGELTGDYSQSVSYASIVFKGRWKAWEEQEDNRDPDTRRKEIIPSLARAVLETHLGHGPQLAEFFLRFGQPALLGEKAGAFVTLNHRGFKAGEPGRLRACMGLMDASQNLSDAVADAAVSASRDPRFPPLKIEELPELEIEVSILSPRRAVDSWREIDISRHGVVLSRNGRQAVFLPQVAREQGWDREEMLSRLAHKAGLPADAWKKGARFEIFEAEIYSEPEAELSSPDKK